MFFVASGIASNMLLQYSPYCAAAGFVGFAVLHMLNYETIKHSVYNGLRMYHTTTIGHVYLQVIHKCHGLIDHHLSISSNPSFK